MGKPIENDLPGVGHVGPSVLLIRGLSVLSGSRSSSIWTGDISPESDSDLSLLRLATGQPEALYHIEKGEQGLIRKFNKITIKMNDTEWWKN